MRFRDFLLSFLVELLDSQEVESLFVSVFVCSWYSMFFANLIINVVKSKKMTTFRFWICFPTLFCGLLFCLSPFPPGRCSFRGPIGAFKRAVRRALWARNHITLRLAAKKALPELRLWKGLGIMGRKGTGSRGPALAGKAQGRNGRKGDVFLRKSA